MSERVNKYIWYKDKKMMGTILLIVTIAVQIFAWLQIPFLSSIHAYTIGMLIGLYNPLFYLFIIYISLVMIFGDKIKIPSWIKINKYSYALISLSIIFIGVSLTFYQSSTGYTSIGLKPWASFDKWFADFTEGNFAWAPNNTNGGILGAFLYSFFAMIVSGIGALIISIITIIFAISYIVTGSVFGFYKNLKRSRDTLLRSKEKKSDSKMDIDSYMSKTETNKTMPILKKDQKEEKNELPFEDPF